MPEVMMLTAILVSGLTFISLIAVAILVFVVRADERTKSVKGIEHKLNALETNFVGIVDQLNAQAGFEYEDMVGQTLFRTADGKYSANSIPELLQKMREAGDLPMPEDEVNHLKTFFDQIIEETEDPPYEEESEEDDEDWKE